MEEEKKDIEVKTEEKNKDKKKVNKKDKETERLNNEINTLNDKVLRLNADIVNIKRRYEEDIRNLYKYDGEDIIKKLLEVVDNFERAIKFDDNDLTDEFSKFLSGFKMIYGSLNNILSEKNVKEIECINKEFDPNTMNAVLTCQDENIESGIVVDVMQKGYTYNDKVIRPAMVKVNE